MSIDEQLQAIEETLIAMAAFSPHLDFTIGETRKLVAAEVARGARKTFLGRLNKELFTTARAVLSPAKHAEFKERLSGKAPEKHLPHAVLEKIALKGRVDTEEEMRQALEELDGILQQDKEFSKEETDAIAGINQILAEFETRNKARIMGK